MVRCPRALSIHQSVKPVSPLLRAPHNGSELSPGHTLLWGELLVDGSKLLHQCIAAQPAKTMPDDRRAEQRRMIAPHLGPMRQNALTKPCQLLGQTTLSSKCCTVRVPAGILGLWRDLARHDLARGNGVAFSAHFMPLQDFYEPLVRRGDVRHVRRWDRPKPVVRGVGRWEHHLVALAEDLHAPDRLTV
jgi:hypothetical protein